LSEKLAPLFKSWGTENVLKRVKGFEDIPIAGLTIEDLYIRAAELHPDRPASSGRQKIPLRPAEGRAL
jgi:hypothetical protein